MYVTLPLFYLTRTRHTVLKKNEYSTIAGLKFPINRLVSPSKFDIPTFNHIILVKGFVVAQDMSLLQQTFEINVMRECSDLPHTGDVKTCSIKTCSI